MSSIPSHVVSNRKRYYGMSRIGQRRVKQRTDIAVEDIAVIGSAERLNLHGPTDEADDERRSCQEINDQLLANSPGHNDNLEMGTARTTGIAFANDPFWAGDFSDDSSSYIDRSDENTRNEDDFDSDSDELLSLPDNFNDNFHEGSTEFLNGVEPMIEEHLIDIDTGGFSFIQEVVLPWISTRKSKVDNNQIGLEKLFDGSNFTTRDLAKDVHKFLVNNGGNSSHARKSVEEDLMCNILLKYLPVDAKLPMDITVNRNKMHYVSTLKKYNLSTDFENRTTWFDICGDSKNCVAFVGDYKKEIKCPKCCTTRYYKCTRPKCLHLSYENCVCNYTSNQRIAKKRVPYRSIIQLFVQLLETESFIDICNTLMAVPEMADMCDIQHGSTYKKHMQECKGRFETWQQEDVEFTKDFINVNLMLSLFYDGIKVYTWKHSTFMPLVISILNLPPTYRCKFGIGQFIVGLLTVSQGNAGEKVMLESLMQELLILNKGVEIVTKKGKKYFLCVRLIQYLLDTPAASKFFNYEGHQAHAGCVYCGRITGKTVKDLSKTVFIGHRFLLPLDHYLRIFGQTGTCCPKDFFHTRLVNRKNTLQQDKKGENMFQIHDLQFYGSTQNKKHSSYNKNPSNSVVQIKQSILWEQGLCIDVEEHRKNVENFVLDQGPSKRFSWNADVDQLLYDNYAYYLTCDLRPQCNPFDPSKRFRDFQRLCSIAERDGCPIQGVKGFSIVSVLPYFNLQEQFCYVNCHVIGNNSSEFFQNVKGFNDSAKSKQCSINTKSFPWYYRREFVEDTGELPWRMTPLNRHILDAHINCIIVPLGYSQDFQVTNPFQQTDVLNLKGKFHAAMTLMELMVHWSFKPFDIAYKAYYLLFSKALMVLTKKKWSTHERIDMLMDIEQKINVLASIHEGIFPLAMQDFINHQMVDLCFGILLFGSCSGFNSFALERAGGIFKRWLKKGGVATEIGIMDRYDLFENHRIDAIYNQKLNEIFKVQPTKDKQVFADINQRALMDNLDPNQLHFTDQRICLHDRIEKNNEDHVSDGEVYALLEDCYKYIIMKIRLEEHHDSQAGYDSALCRVFYSFYSYQKKSLSPDETFQNYFEDVHSFSGTENPEKILRSKYFIGPHIGCLPQYSYMQATVEDLHQVLELVSELKTNMVVYQNAHVYGLTFKSRKIINANNLKYNWNSPEHIQSWVKFIDYTNYEDTTTKTSFGRRAYNSTDKYMNINYFFRINFPNESHLHGMAFANGTSRNSFKTKCINPEEWYQPTPSKLKEGSKNSSSSSSSSSSSNSSSDQESTIHAPDNNDENNYLEHILVGDEKRSLHQKSTFIPCVYFFATKVMIIPYHVSNFKFPESELLNAISLRKCIDTAKPLLLKNKSIDISPDCKKFYASCEPHAVNFLTMIDLHPAKCLEYSFNDMLKGCLTQFINRYLHNPNLDVK